MKSKSISYRLVFLISLLSIGALWKFTKTTHIDVVGHGNIKNNVVLLQNRIHKQIEEKSYTPIDIPPLSYTIFSNDTIVGWKTANQFPGHLCNQNHDNTLLKTAKYKNLSYCISLESIDDITYGFDNQNKEAKKNNQHSLWHSFVFALLFIILYISGVKMLSYLPRMLEFLAISAYTILIPFIHLAINHNPLIQVGTYVDLVGLICVAIYLLALSRILNKDLVVLQSKLSYFLSYLFISGSVFGFYLLIHYILNESSIYSLSSTAIQYSLDGLLLLTVLVALGIALFFLHYSISTKVVAKTKLKERYLYQGISIPLTALGFYFLDIPIIGVGAFVMAYILILDVFTEHRKSTLIYGFWWLILLSGFVAASTYKGTIDKDRKDRRLYLQELYQARQESSTIQAKEISKRLLNSEVFTPLSEISGLESIDGADYTSYITQQLGLDTFLASNTVVDVHGFDAQSTSLFSRKSKSYHNLQYELLVSERVNDRIFYNPLVSTYFLVYDIENRNSKKPHKVILSIRKESSTQRKFKNFGYVLYKDSQVIYTHNHESYPGKLEDLYHADERKFTHEYAYIVEQLSPQIRVVSFKKVAGIIRAISLFSLVLALASAISLILTYVNKRWQVIPHQIAFDGDDKNSLRRKIQTSIIMLIVFSFIIIGIVTTYYFKNILDTSSRQNVTESNLTIYKNIKHKIEDADSDLSAAILLNNNIEHLNTIYNRDIAIISPEMSSYSGIHSPPPILSMDEKKQLDMGQAIEQNIKGQSRIIFPLFHSSERPYAYASINTTTRKSAYSILDFLSTILNVYVFLFLTASAIAIGISNSITRPLTKLAEKLKRFKLGKQNATLDWKTTDEIGMLINDYNNLVVKLKESADIIAKTHRDTAWREMAKQVAHEIKNPLTPMKLTIQYLERKLKADPDNADKIIARASSTLIEQIDNLSRIADEFSNFATMPKTSNENVVVNDVVETIHDLFRKREDIDINLQLPIQDITVFADKNQLSRVLINLVKNAIQAIPNDRKGKIDIKLYAQKNNAIIQVTDNGSGISDAMKSKVFEPNFTTKNSGTGLGLAMSANIIEAFNGKLYFETEWELGTSFFIEIPLMRLDSNYDGIERISLN